MVTTWPWRLLKSKRARRLELLRDWRQLRDWALLYEDTWTLAHIMIDMRRLEYGTPGDPAVEAILLRWYNNGWELEELRAEAIATYRDITAKLLKP